MREGIARQQRFQDIRQQLISERRNRIQSLSTDEAILSKDYGPERRSFRRYRDDPARDTQTSVYRSELAEEIQAQRIGQRALAEERNRALSNKQSYFTSDRRITEQALRDKEREAKEADRLERELILSQSSYAEHDPRRPLTRPTRRVDPNTISRSTFANMTDAERTAFFGGAESKGRTVLLGGIPGGPGGPGGGDDEEGGGGGKGPGLGFLGRVTRNFLVYRALSELTFGTVKFTEASLAAAKAVSEQGNALLFATEAAHGNLEANRALVGQLTQLGYNRATGAQVVAAAARATFRHPEQTEALAREATDIAALRGGGLQEAPKVIEDIIGGRDRPYREYFNTTPEEIYKEAAKKRLAQNAPTFGLTTVGKGQDYETEAQKVSKYVAALTEQEKEQLRLNFVLSQAYRFQGDAAERAGTLAGKIDLLSSAFFNARANFGAFVADFKPVRDILDTLQGASPDSIFNPPVLRRGGPQNTVTDANIAAYGADVSTSSRASTLGFLNRIYSFVSDTLINPGGNLTPRGIAQVVNRPSPRQEIQYDQTVAENRARTIQQRDLEIARREGRTGFRATGIGAGLPNEYFTREQLTARGVSGQSILKDYIEELKPVLLDGAKALEDYRQKYADLQATIDKDKKAGYENKNAQEQQNLLEARRDADDLYAGFKPADYDTEARKREDDRRAKEQKNIQQYVSELGGALNKLRDAQQGAFRLPGDIGSSLTGGENPYVKVLSDQATAAERMRQQWGFLGKDATDYFTKLEKFSVERGLLKIDYQSYRTKTGLLGQADREAAERTGPGLSRGDQEYLNIQEAIVNRAVQIPQLWKQAAEVLGYTLGPTQSLIGQIGLITQAFGVRGPNTSRFGNAFNTDLTQVSGIARLGLGNPLYSPFGAYQQQARLGNPLALPGGEEAYRRQAGNPLYNQPTVRTFSEIGAGQTPEVREALRKSFADSVLGAFQGYSPAQIRNSGLQDVYLGALNIQRGSLGFNIDQARRKAEFSAAEDTRLSAQLQQDERFRRDKEAGLSGRTDLDAKRKKALLGEVGRESDTLLLSRTEGINPKDLTFEQFKDRQDALRRQAERTESDREEAKAAVREGLILQQQLLTTVHEIRAGIFAGNLNLLVQVQNDTQAKIDQQALEAISSGRFNIPLDQGETKSNPYTGLNDRYGRGGRKR
jgi:hypothetical protein